MLETTVLEKEAKSEQDSQGQTRQRGKKSSSAYRTISEVAHELKVEQHVLRFWESKFKQVEPMKRAGGRRYYAPKDVDTLKKIHFLLYTKGYTIKGAHKFLSSRKSSDSELAGIEKQFELSEPIEFEKALPQELQPQISPDTSGDLFGTTMPHNVMSELAQILSDLKDLRKTLNS